jgi:hypothetical protein
MRRTIKIGSVVALSVFGVTGILLLFISLRFQVQPESSNIQEAKQTSGTYVAQTVSLKGERGVFLQWLEDSQLPLATQLQQEGLLSGQRVYELQMVSESKTENVEWDYLILYELSEGITPDSFLQRTDALLIGNGQASDGSPFETYRIEILDSTPGAYYPLSSEAAQGDRAVAYTVEYINVHVDALTDYQTSMVENSGPAMKELVARSFVHNFIALETTQIIYAKPEGQSWNQIHVIGFKPLNLPRFIPTYDQVLWEVTPGGKGFDEVVDHLNEICENTRVDLSRELAQFRL